MRISLLIIFYFSVLWRSNAQQADRFTLEACINYALANSINIKNAQLDQEIAGARVKETVGIGLPQVSGSVGVQHNNQLPRFFTQYNPNGGFVDLSGVPGVQPGDVVSAENFFQLKSAGDAKLSINQIIFNGSYIVGLQAANAYKDLSYKSRLQTEEEVVLNVTKAFYNLLINQERLQLFDANIARIDTVLRNTIEMYKNGFAEKLDVDRIKVTFNNLKTERDNFIKLDGLALQLLKFQMNYPLAATLIIDGSINEELIADITDSVTLAWDYSERPDYQVLQANYTLQKLNIKNKYAEGLPSINAFANFGYSTQSPTVGGIFRTESNIANSDGFGPDSWYSYSLIGIGVQWNIFTGLSRNYKIQQEKFALKQIENGFESLEKSIDFQRVQAQVSLENARKSLDSQAENMKLAEDIVDITQRKFEAGLGSNLELIEAQNSLKEAQTNYYEALYSAIIAKTDLLKAFGKLYN